jgi:hypothetical protein
MAARTTRIQHDENTRKKIQSSQLINRLTNHVLNDLDMSSTQVNAALGLLKKTLPDLKQSDVTIGAIELTHEQWLGQLIGSEDGSSSETKTLTIKK